MADGKQKLVIAGVVLAFPTVIIAFALAASLIVPLLVGVSAISGLSAALSENQKQEVCTPGTSNTPGSLVGDSLEQKGWNFLVQSGFTEQQAAGIMGNIKRESQFNPFLAENNSATPVIGRGWGLVQWTAGRHTQVKNAVVADPSLGTRFYVAAPSADALPAGISPADADAMLYFQLKYIVQELDGVEAKAGKSIRAAKTVEEATTVFERDYERAGVVALSERIAAANAYYEQFKGSGAGAGGGSTSTAPAAGSITPILGFSDKAMQTAALIASTTSEAGYSDQAAVLAITTAIGESSLGDDPSAMNHINNDGDTGLYQMRVIQRDGAYYGTEAQVRDTKWATIAWLNGVDTKAGHMKGLKDVSGWETMAPEQAIHAVQGNSASTNYVYVNNYEKAKQLFTAVSGKDASSLGGATTVDAGCMGGGAGITDAGTVQLGPNGEAVNIPYLTQSSVSLKCPPGTTDAGTDEGWYEGKMVMIRLCAVDGETQANGNPVIVNATAAQNFLNFLADMKGQGFDLNFTSSFRSMAKQESIYGSSPGNAARPGWSNHQFGMAFDMQLSGSYSRNNCAGKTVPEGACIQPNTSAMWQAARDTGLKYGMYIMDQEFWHIEFLPSGWKTRNRDISVYNG